MKLSRNKSPPDFEKYNGKPIEKIPKLISENKRILSVADIVREKLESKDSLYWNHFQAYTGDAIAYHPDGRLKIVLDAKALEGLNSESRLIEGALALPDGMYEKIEGQEYRASDSKLENCFLNKRKARSDPVLKFLLQEPKLLNDYIDLMFELKRNRPYLYTVKTAIKGAGKENNMVTMRPLEVAMLQHPDIFTDRVNLDDANRSCIVYSSD